MVANCVVFVPGAAVGAVGVPVNDGEAIVARNNISAVFAVMLDVLEAINVGNVDIVDALTPPTLVTVDVNVPKPPPVTSPVNSTY